MIWLALIVLAVVEVALIWMLLDQHVRLGKIEVAQRIDLAASIARRSAIESLAEKLKQLGDAL